MVSKTPPGVARRHRPRCGLASFASLAIGSLLLSGCADGGSQADGPIVFGGAAPLSESYGISTQRGAELAMREINAANGVNGRKLEITWLDDGANQRQAIASAEALVRDARVLAVVGHVNSSTTIAAAPTYHDGGLPAVATSATSPKVSTLGEWIFRVAPSDSAIAVRLAELAHGRGGNVAIYYSNEEYGRGLARPFRDELVRRGTRVVSLNPYMETMEDFRPYLQRTQAQDVRTILIAGVETGAARLIAQARAMGIDAHFIGGDGLEGLAPMGRIYDGTLVGVLYDPGADDDARSFAERYHAVYGDLPDSFAATAYDAVRLLAGAVEAGHATRSSIREYLARVGVPGGAPAFRGVTGEIRFDANGDPANKQFAIVTLRDGQREVYGGSR
jgi:branched-chain amino acid transport system substrate-binding protein